MEDVFTPAHIVIVCLTVFIIGIFVILNTLARRAEMKSLKQWVVAQFDDDDGNFISAEDLADSIAQDLGELDKIITPIVVKAETTYGDSPVPQNNELRQMPSNPPPIFTGFIHIGRCADCHGPIYADTQEGVPFCLCSHPRVREQIFDGN